MVSGVPGAPLTILTADCLPIILADPKKRVVAAVHAGWRGTFDKIAANAVKIMIEAGADCGSIEARLGPHIGSCCFEVGTDLYSKFADKFCLAPVAGKPCLDLALLNKSILVESGLRPESIRILNLCTRDNPELFYSWRRDGATGRQATVVGLLP